VILWRIATETRNYAADDLSGAGAAKSPGRWNAEKQSVVYAAPTIAMAVLETAAHIDDAGFPLNRFLLRIDVPDAAWKKRVEVHVDELSPTWSAIPAGRASVRVGSDWIVSGRSLIFLAPSVIVPEEQVALINPAHPSAVDVKATVIRPFHYNRLFRGNFS
jgi:RES domain-containing protein